MLKPRNRLINFRVTDEEYEELKVACSNRGARCLSDFARTIILAAADVTGNSLPAPGGPMHERIADVERRIETIESNLERLLNAVSAQVTTNAAS